MSTQDKPKLADFMPLLVPAVIVIGTLFVIVYQVNDIQKKLTVFEKVRDDVIVLKTKQEAHQNQHAKIGK